MSIAIVTGGNSGIGRASAVALARRGFDLGLTWHSEEERLREAVAECEAEGVRVEARRADLSDVPGRRRHVWTSALIWRRRDSGRRLRAFVEVAESLLDERAPAE